MKLKVFLTIFALFSADAFAQELQGKFQDWSVFKTQRGDRVVCYAASLPIKREGNYDKRGEPFFLVTDIENDADEISVSSGFLYGKNSDVEVSFGSKKFYLFPYKAMAWANDKNEDIDIIKEMQKRTDIIVTGIETSGRIAVDTYSLLGFAESYEKLKQLCEDSH